MTAKTQAHTPGPWQLDHTPRDEAAGYIIREKSSLFRIAYVYPDDSNVHHGDAKLIAAAPDLLEAARTAIEIMPHFPEGGVLNRRVKSIKSAIAKAEGR